MRTGRRAGSGQASLIGLLVVMAIIMVATYFLWLRPRQEQAAQQPPRFEGEAQTPLGRAVQTGQAVQCQEYLRQLRMMVQMEYDTTGQYPPALSPGWGIPLTCGVSGQAFGYDPNTGRVWDPTPGHEGY